MAGGGGTGGGTGDYVVDLTPPPAPENLEASGTIGGIILTVDAPTFTVGHGHAYTEFWRNTINARGSAIKIGMAPGKYSSILSARRWTTTTIGQGLFLSMASLVRSMPHQACWVAHRKIHRTCSA